MTGKPHAPISVIADSDTFGAGGTLSRGRRDVATGDVYDAADLIRFVLSPDGIVTPDIFGKLPGRGAWVAANREALELAIKSKAFSRSFKGKAIVPGDIADQVEAGLAVKLLGLLGMSTKSGDLSMGFDQVQMSVRSDSPALRIEASDGAPDGRGKVRVITKAIAHELELNAPPVIGCFDRYELGRAVGRDALVHGVVRRGKMAKALKAAAVRLSGFRPLIPPDWPDSVHETSIIKGSEKPGLSVE